MKKLISVLLTVIMLIPFALTAAEGDYDPQMPFSDAKPGQWYYSAVKYCAVNGLLNGMSETKFGLNTTVSRAMFVQALANMEGITEEDLSEEPCPFSDVQPKHWFYVAVEWARQNNIVSGLSDTKFGPNDPLTREQMARLFHQYAIFKGLPAEGTADLSGFSDSSKIHDWALEGMNYCVSVGLFVGDGGKLTPRAKATRAQLAVVLYKFDYQNKYNLPIPDSTDADSLLVEASDKDRIVIYGDSMAARLNRDPLRQILGKPVTNYGVGGESAQAMARRQGGMAFYAEPMTIPADTTPVEITLVDDEGDHMDLGYFGDGISNEFIIAGVEGKVAYTDGEPYFTRNTAGDEVTFTNRTRVITSGMQSRREGDILVIWGGSNNRYSAADTYKLIDIIEDMIAYSGTDEYVVIGLTSKTYMAEVDGINANLEAHFSDRFVDVRSYLKTEQCLIDHGITPTEADYNNIAIGEIPASLLADDVHGTQLFYDIVSQMVAEKITELGYLA